MSALSNAKTRRDGHDSPTIGLTSNVLPKASSSDTGVSVGNAPPQAPFAYNPKKKWYVLRITYYRAQKAYDLLTKNDIETYMPMRWVKREIDGKEKRITRPLIPNLLFVYTTFAKLDAIVKTKDGTNARSFITYYYDHFNTGPNGKNPPLTVRNDDMANFIRLTSIANEHIMVVKPELCHYRNGDMVKIVDGEFKGICGRVARVAGQQRVVVELKGVCLATTAYVPSSFIKKLT
ncbi:UpxY family transcription antiterminator [Prevotella sp.]|uniref:UpxY family transcription antiterminator n=1 Tax=Prevotella sp. TaxID=59823 RepID=UPI0027E2AA95|nr:UpxY family transcription antiterminator [Prevotella sp.]